MPVEMLTFLGGKSQTLVTSFSTVEGEKKGKIYHCCGREIKITTQSNQTAHSLRY